MEQQVHEAWRVAWREGGTSGGVHVWTVGVHGACAEVRLAGMESGVHNGISWSRVAYVRSRILETSCRYIESVLLFSRCVGGP